MLNGNWKKKGFFIDIKTINCGVIVLAAAISIKIFVYSRGFPMIAKNGYWFIWYFKIGLSTITTTIQLYELNCSMTNILIDVDYRV